MAGHARTAGEAPATGPGPFGRSTPTPSERPLLRRPRRSEPGTAEADAFVDRLAAVEHERWAHWQQYMHEQCRRSDDGSLAIPAELVTRWTRQINTRYGELSETERGSDREQTRVHELRNGRDVCNTVVDMVLVGYARVSTRDQHPQAQPMH
jgi:hypothetical protein